MQETSTQTSQTSTTTTATTTTTPQESAKAETLIFNSFRDLATNLSHAKVYYRHTNGSEVDEIYLEYTVSETSNGFKVVLNVTNVNNGEQNIMTIYLDNDMETVTRVELPGQPPLTGQTAQMVGQQLLGFINAILAPIAFTANIEVELSEGAVIAENHGWTVVSTQKTSVEVSGTTYNAYKINIENKNDVSTDMKKAEITLIELLPNTWVLQHSYAVTDKGETFDWQIVELTKA